MKTIGVSGFWDFKGEAFWWSKLESLWCWQRKGSSRLARKEQQEQSPRQWSKDHYKKHFTTPRV